MLQYIFTWSPIWLFVLFFLCGLLCFFSGMIALKVFRQQFLKNELTMPVAAFIGTVATAWALALGFAAADVWQINNAASQAASAERSSISRLEGMAKPEALDALHLMQALSEYRLTVSDIEWSEDLNRLPAKEVENALQKLRVAIIELAHSSIPEPIVSQIVQDFDELQDARNTRLALGSSSINHYKWYLVICLTVLTSIVVASVHADRPRAGKKALIIYSLTAAVSLWILAIHAHPYTGAGHLNSNTLRVKVGALKSKPMQLSLAGSAATTLQQ